MKKVIFGAIGGAIVGAAVGAALTKLHYERVIEEVIEEVESGMASPSLEIIKPYEENSRGDVSEEVPKEEIRVDIPDPDDVKDYGKMFEEQKLTEPDIPKVVNTPDPVIFEMYETDEKGDYIGEEPTYNYEYHHLSYFIGDGTWFNSVGKPIDYELLTAMIGEDAQYAVENEECSKLIAIFNHEVRQHYEVAREEGNGEEIMLKLPKAKNPESPKERAARLRKDDE